MRRLLAFLRFSLWSVLVLVALVASLFGYYVYTPASEVPRLSGTLTSSSIEVAGIKRAYLTYVPQGLARGAPLVVVMHGSGQNGVQVRSETGYGFDRLADEHGFVVVYPHADEGYWDVCSKVGAVETEAHRIDEMGFLTGLVDKLVTQQGVDPGRVFAVGSSRGGSMALRLALEAPARFRAVAAVSASVPTPENFRCKIPVQGTSSVMIMNGTNDPIVPFEGGEVSLFGLFYKNGNMLSSRKSGQFFADLNRLSGAPQASEIPLADGIREAFHRVRRETEASLREWPVAPAVRPPEIRRYLADVFTFRDSREAADLVLEVAALLKDGTVHVTHPRYFGLYIPSVRRVSVVAEALAAHFNPQLAAWSHAPAANEIERHTLAFLIAKLGLDASRGGGCFTSGGMEANLTALLTALCDAFPTLRQSGLTGLQGRPRFYVSEEAHHSFEKAATVTGLGLASLCRIPVDTSLRMDVSALQRAIEQDRDAGDVPFLVVGTAGTTGSGAIDPLTALASLAEKQGLWFHVDAAWGGFACLSPVHRDHLDGIQSADSVTWDAHKGLAVPLGAGMFFCREREAMTRTFGLSTGYMPASSADTLEPYASSLQWSRRFIGLTVFMALAELGEVGVATQIEHQFRMGAWMVRELQARGWDVVNSTPLPVVCFTRTGLPRTESALDQRLAPLLARGQVWISKVSLPGQGWVLRACITSSLTDENDLKILLDELDALRSS